VFFFKVFFLIALVALAAFFIFLRLQSSPADFILLIHIRIYCLCGQGAVAQKGAGPGSGAGLQRGRHSSNNFCHATQSGRKKERFRSLGLSEQINLMWLNKKMLKIFLRTL